MSNYCIQCGGRKRNRSRRLCSVCDSGRRRINVDGEAKWIVIILSILASLFIIGFKLTVGLFVMIAALNYYLKWRKSK